MDLFGADHQIMEKTMASDGKTVKKKNKPVHIRYKIKKEDIILAQ